MKCRRNYFLNSFDNKINKTYFRLECNVSYVLSLGLSSRYLVRVMERLRVAIN